MDRLKAAGIVCTWRTMAEGLDIPGTVFLLTLIIKLLSTLEVSTKQS